MENLKQGDKIKSNIYEWEHHYIIEDVNIVNDSRGTILLSCIYSKYENQKPEIFTSGQRLMVVDKGWFNENPKRKIELILL